MRPALILAIAVFLTASYRLLVLPVSDTMRMAALALLIAGLSAGPELRLRVGYLVRMRALLGLLAFAAVLDLMLARVGLYTVIFWGQFLAILLVGNAVFSLSGAEKRRLLHCVALFLSLQLAMLLTRPAQFADYGRLLGVEDPFTLHGATLDRLYFAYFQANTAAYAVYYFLLSWLVLCDRIQVRHGERLGLAVLFFGFALLTGSRGVILLSVPFLLVWFLMSRRAGAALFALLVPVGLGFAVPLYDATIDLVLLREESNTARLAAVETYLGFIRDHPVWGVGAEAARDRVAETGALRSHVFFVEVLGIYGLPLGALILIVLLSRLVLAPRDRRLVLAGGFALAVGLFNNTLLSAPAFLGAFVPIFLSGLTPQVLPRSEPPLPVPMPLAAGRAQKG